MRHRPHDPRPKGVRNRFFKDPAASAEKFDAEAHAVESPCDFAWCDQRVRAALREWLRDPGDGRINHTISFEMRVTRAVVVRAMFQRDTRLVAEHLMAVAIDPLSPKTVYCGVEMPCPPPIAITTIGRARTWRPDPPRGAF